MTSVFSSSTSSSGESVVAAGGGRDHRRLVFIICSFRVRVLVTSGKDMILALNASYFLKNGGHFVISIKANCIDSTMPVEAVFASEVEKLKADQFKPSEQVTLEPFKRDHVCA